MSNDLKILKSIVDKQYKETQAKKGRKPRAKPKQKPKPSPELIVKNGMSSEELKSVYDRIIIERELGSRSMREYAKLCWKQVEPGIPYDLNAWHSDCLSEHMEALVKGDIQRLLISIPPGHGKSTWANIFFPTFAWLHKPWWKMAFGSYGQGLMNRDAEKCLRLLKSKWWRNRWGDRFDITKGTIGKINNSMGGIRAVSSIRGQTLGIRADAVVADDPLNILEVNSEVARGNVHFWWDNGMRSRGNIHQVELVIMQRLHDADLIGYLLSDEVNVSYEVLKLPAEYEPRKKCTTFKLDGSKFWEDPRKNEGDLLFPSLFPLKFLEERGRQSTDNEGRNLYSAMYQQEPVQAGGNIIKTAWFRYYHGSPEEQYSQCHRAILSCDPAVKEKDTSTYTVIQIWGVKGPNVYLIDQLRRKLAFTGIVEAIKMMIDKWNQAKGPGVSAKLIEDKATGPAVIDTLQNLIPGLIAFPGDDDKSDRLEAITWLWQAGNVHVPGKVAKDGEHRVDFSHVPWMDGEEGFVAEVTRFPKSKYTDQTITMSQALMHLAKMMKNMVGFPTGVTRVGNISKIRAATDRGYYR